MTRPVISHYVLDPWWSENIIEQVTAQAILAYPPLNETFSKRYPSLLAVTKEVMHRMTDGTTMAGAMASVALECM